MCNLYSDIFSRKALIDLNRELSIIDSIGNYEPYRGIFSGYKGRIIRNLHGGWELTEARRSMPPFKPARDGKADLTITNISPMQGLAV